jgi:hypothetical protein
VSSDTNAADTLTQLQSQLDTGAENMKLRLIKLSENLRMSITQSGEAALYDASVLDGLEDCESTEEQIALLDGATLVKLSDDEVYALAQIFSMHVIFTIANEEDEDGDFTVH